MRKIAGNENGFSLIELILAMTLLAGLVGVLSQGFNLSIRVWEAADRKIDGHYSITEGMNLINRELKSARNVYTYEVNTGARRMVFAGDSNSVAYVTSSPRFATKDTESEAGLYLKKITYEPAERAVYFEETVFNSNLPIDEHEGIVLKIGGGKIANFTIEYFAEDITAGRTPGGEMVFEWSDSINLEEEAAGSDMRNVFPDAVRISWQVSGTEPFVWPDQFIPVFQGNETEVVGR
jgi:prepilin-type N-terminal cleavage/methylation domain-containing protein